MFFWSVFTFLKFCHGMMEPKHQILAVLVKKIISYPCLINVFGVWLPGLFLSTLSYPLQASTCHTRIVRHLNVDGPLPHLLSKKRQPIYKNKKPIKYLLLQETINLHQSMKMDRKKEMKKITLNVHFPTTVWIQTSIEVEGLFPPGVYLISKIFHSFPVPSVIKDIYL